MVVWSCIWYHNINDLNLGKSTIGPWANPPWETQIDDANISAKIDKYNNIKINIIFWYHLHVTSFSANSFFASIVAIALPYRYLDVSRPVLLHAVDNSVIKRNYSYHSYIIRYKQKDRIQILPLMLQSLCKILDKTLPILALSCFIELMMTIKLSFVS